MNNNPTALIHIKVSQLHNNGPVVYGIVLKHKGKEKILSYMFENNSIEDGYVFALRDVLKILHDSINIIVYSNLNSLENLFYKNKYRIRLPKHMTIKFKRWDKYNDNEIRLQCESIAREAIIELGD